MLRLLRMLLGLLRGTLRGLLRLLLGLMRGLLRGTLRGLLHGLLLRMLLMLLGLMRGLLRGGGGGSVIDNDTTFLRIPAGTGSLYMVVFAQLRRRGTEFEYLRAYVLRWDDSD